MRSVTTTRLLARALARTEPHVRRTDDRPELGAVRLEAAGDHLYAVTTDRRTLALDRIDADNAGPWHAHLHRAHVPLVRLWLNGIDPDAQVRIGAAPSGAGTAITLRAGHNMLRIVNSRPEQEQFPAWRRIVTERIGAPTDMVNLTGYNPAFLARFAVLNLPGLHAWQAGPEKPLILTSDDGFLGMVMPAKQAPVHRAALVASWTKALSPA
jgi:hypothetical protein